MCRRSEVSLWSNHGKAMGPAFRHRGRCVKPEKGQTELGLG